MTTRKNPKNPHLLARQARANMAKADAEMPEPMRAVLGVSPRCGHSACRQNYIDTGEVRCVEHADATHGALHADEDKRRGSCAECGDAFTSTGPGARSAADTRICKFCYQEGA